MPRWLWFLPVVMLAALFALHGIKLGMLRAGLTETDVINHYAAQYVEDHRVAYGSLGQLTDCYAVPSDFAGGVAQAAGVWIELSCKPSGQMGREAPFLYGIKRNGTLAYVARGAAQEL